MGTFLYRMMGAATLDAGIYEALESDPRATVQAAVIVVLSSLSAAVGASGIYGPEPGTLAGVAGIALIGWISWASLTLQVGVRWFREPATSADAGQLLRTLGFAATPGLFQAFAIFPRVSTIVFVFAWAWMLAAMVVAVKHALDFRSTARAIGVCLFAAALCLAVAATVGLLFGPEVS